MPEFSYEINRHPQTGWQLVQLTCHGASGGASATVAPDAGANLFQFAVDGIEYLYDFQQPPSGPASLAGTPILYPTPNRMRDARFTFDGQPFVFEPNKGKHAAHGLVRYECWQWEEPIVSTEGVSMSCFIRFTPGTRWFKYFPIRNRLTFTYTLGVNVLRIDMTVHNEDEQRRLPFGLAIHPFFRIHGPRRSVSIVVPGEQWMDAVDLLPTGRLLDMREGPADLRQRTSLEGLDLDHVICGMVSEKPAVIMYHELAKCLVLRADDFFTHSVIYTPDSKPYFCIENQSCSTDAHNLFARGYKSESHLVILDPGESLKTWVEFQVEDV
jgi:aldose 1-epimerase